MPDREPNLEQQMVDAINDLYAQGKKERDNKLGPNWWEGFQSFYELKDLFATGFVNAYYPPVKIPKLQMMALQEATDLTDITPRIFIAKTLDLSEQDVENQQAVQAQWQQSKVNMALFNAELLAYHLGDAFIQIGYDPFARNGFGDIYCDWRSPHTVVVDPNAKSDDDWEWVITEDFLYRDWLVARYPEQGHRIPYSDPTRTISRSDRPDVPELPKGPMRSLGNGLFAQGTPNSPLVRTRTLYCRDYSIQELPEREAQPDDILAPPDYTPRYPRGRMVVEANGVVLLDTDNWVPNGRFPLVRVAGMPSVTSFWSPPPTRFSKSLQELAEKMVGQTYENMVRVNRQMAFVRKDSGIDIDTFANVPTAVYEYNMTSQPPTFAGPPEFPAHYLQVPDILLQLQQDIQGFTESRQGKAPAGNISAPLVEAAISQSQTLTKMRAKLMAESVAKIGELLLQAMVVYFKSERKIPAMDGGQLKPAVWTPVDEKEMRYAHLDPASVRPMSQTTMRMMVPLLRQMKMLSVDTGLKMLDFPGSEEEAQKVAKEMEMAALAGAKKGGK